MTKMKRITVSLTDEIDQGVKEIQRSSMRKRSYTDILRELLALGIERARREETIAKEMAK